MAEEITYCAAGDTGDTDDEERRIDQLSVLLNGDPVEVTIRGERYAMRANSDPQLPDLPYEFRAGRVAYPDTLRIED